MRSVLVAFAILLAILLSISALGGSLNVSERFYEDVLDETEAFYEEVAKEEAENFSEDTTPPNTADPLEPTGPTTPSAPDAMPSITAETKEEYYEEEGEGEGEGEDTIEPFEEDNTFMPY